MDVEGRATRLIALNPANVLDQSTSLQVTLHTFRSNTRRLDTEEEWSEFEKHFTLRKVAYGNCDRPYSSPCAHEHACVRCPMLRPQPSRLPLLRELETNLNERLVEARERVWLGEVEGLKKTLVDLRAKTEQAERLAAAGITDTPVSLN
jgi:hypothetical protein